MKETIKFICYMCLSLLALVLTMVGIDYLRSETEFEPSSRVLVTAAHLGDIEGYTCIYADEDTDVGVYLKEGYVAAKPPITSEVTYLNTKGYIYSVTDTEFVMEPLSIESIVPGVSGTPVYYHGEPIGYISGWDGNGRVRCIFY